MPARSVASDETERVLAGILRKQSKCDHTGMRKTARANAGSMADRTVESTQRVNEGSAQDDNATKRAALRARKALLNNPDHGMRPYKQFHQFGLLFPRRFPISTFYLSLPYRERCSKRPPWRDHRAQLFASLHASRCFFGAHPRHMLRHVLIVNVGMEVAHALVHPPF